MEKFKINVNGHTYMVHRTASFQQIYNISSREASYEIAKNKEGKWECLDSGYASEPINVNDVGNAIENAERTGKQLSAV